MPTRMRKEKLRLRMEGLSRLVHSGAASRGESDDMVGACCEEDGGGEVQEGSSGEALELELDVADATAPPSW